MMELLEWLKSIIDEAEPIDSMVAMGRALWIAALWLLLFLPRVHR